MSELNIDDEIEKKEEVKYVFVSTKKPWPIHLGKK